MHNNLLPLRLPSQHLVSKNNRLPVYSSKSPIALQNRTFSGWEVTQDSLESSATATNLMTTESSDSCARKTPPKEFAKTVIQEKFPSVQEQGIHITQL